MTATNNVIAHKYRSDIDGLRAVAVLLVVLFHAFPSRVKGGFIGVDIFFVISGYLISTIIFENVRTQRFSFTEFYVRRIKRIFPALILVLGATYIFGWFALFADEYAQLGKHIAGGAGFTSNFMLWKESGYFDNAAETKPLLHLWSLGIEEQFYLLWPLLVFIAWKLRLNLLIVAAILAAASFTINIIGIHRDGVASFYLPQMRFWELMLGSILAGVSPVSMQSAQAKLQPYQSAFGVALIIAAALFINKSKHFPGWWALLPTLGAVLIIASSDKAWFNRVVLSHPILVWFGLISFPLYLWHWPLLSLLKIVEGDSQSMSLKLL
ncbi:MAG: acyltransferase, partial [Pseudomonadota bacterium]|nr:acyltransferase [Pseudomonadota bacterium]